MAGGRNRVLVNRQPLQRARDLLGVAAGHGVRPRRPRAGEGRPGGAPALPRRRAGGARTPATTRCAARSTRSSAAQRPAQAGRAAGSTSRGVHPRRVGRQAGRGRRAAGRGARRRCSTGSRRCSARPTTPWPGRRRSRLGRAAYDAPWRGEGGCAAALAAAAARGRPAPRRVHGRARTATTSTCTSAACRPAPTPPRASSGRWPWRCGWRAHHVVTEVDRAAPPVLLLDDVFSELDPDRSDALLANLPAGQTLLTTATALPPEARPDLVLRLVDGEIVR